MPYKNIQIMEGHRREVVLMAMVMLMDMMEMSRRRRRNLIRQKGVLQDRDLRESRGSLRDEKGKVLEEQNKIEAVMDMEVYLS